MNVHPDHKLIRVPDAVEAVTGIRPDPVKCWRWCNNGVKGIVLKSCLVGGSRVSCVAWVREFIEARSNPQPIKPIKQPKLTKHTREFLKRELGI